MKKAIAVLVLIFAVNLVNAQSPIGKGSLTLGGSISYSSQSYENVSDNTTTFTFNPQVGYFFIDNFYTALSVNYEHVASGGVSRDQLGIGPALRYYFDLGQIKPFAGVGYTYNQNTYSSIDEKFSSTEFKLTGGVDFFLTNSFALEASVNYSFINYKYPGDYYIYNDQTSKLFQIAVGINYFIY